MKILLTGHKGFLGRHIYNILKLDGAHDVCGFDCDSKYDLFANMFQEMKSQREEYDLIVHCGALSNSQVTSNLLWQLNYKASTEIANYCEQTRTKLLFISSAAAIDPDVPYGWSKHCAEYYMFQTVERSNLCIFRPFNIWDYDELEKESPSIVYKILAGKLEKAYQGCLRDFVHVSDAANAVIRVINDWTSGVFDLGTAEETNIATLVNQLFRDGIRYKHSKPTIINECPIRRRLVARPEKLLQNWTATPLAEYLVELEQHLRET